LDDSLVETYKVLEEQRIQNPTTTGMIEEKDLPAVAETIAYNAIKYFDLCHPRDYLFSFNSMLSMKGNTAVYLLYALTRIASIKRKIPDSRKDSALLLSPSDSLLLSTEEDRSLALSILQFSDVISHVERTLSPHYLCEYLFTLASKFHLFYDRCRILGDPLEQHRLQLCIAVEKILKQGSNLLGLNVVDKM
jgi:arginyl-tRNA synthetase